MIVEVNYLGTEMEVTGDYTPGKPAYVTGPPEDCYPEEPAEFDIEEVTVGGVSVYSMLECLQTAGSPRLTPATCLEEIAVLCLEKAGESDDDY